LEIDLPRIGQSLTDAVSRANANLTNATTLAALEGHTLSLEEVVGIIKEELDPGNFAFLQTEVAEKLDVIIQYAEQLALCDLETTQSSGRRLEGGQNLIISAGGQVEVEAIVQGKVALFQAWDLSPKNETSGTFFRYCFGATAGAGGNLGGILGFTWGDLGLVDLSGRSRQIDIDVPVPIVNGVSYLTKPPTIEFEIGPGAALSGGRQNCFTTHL